MKIVIKCENYNLKSHVLDHSRLKYGTHLAVNNLEQAATKLEDMFESQGYDTYANSKSFSF